MKNKLILILFLILTFKIAIVNAGYEDEYEKVYKGHVGANIVAGAGYSSNTQQVAPQICYNAKIGSVSNEQGFLHLNSAMSFSDFEKNMGFDGSVKGKYGNFSGSAEAHYLREMEDKDRSLSLNYYEFASEDAFVQLNGFGKESLNDSGRSFYDDGKNKYFGVICGDNYISSYKQGAMLIMGLNINFRSHYEKQKFEAEAKLSFGDIFSASSEVKRIATEHNMQGSISVNAFQKGGDPLQLAEILNEDASGEYYSLTCDLRHMDDCVKVASGMLNYVENIFPEQFSFEYGIGLVPLGIGFIEYEPVKYIGLEVPDSLVTD